MCAISRLSFLNTLFVVCVINTNDWKVRAENIDVKNNNLDDVLIGELYSLYKDSFENGKMYLTRRVFVNDKQYTLHVQKLKEVHGLKMHNLRVEGRTISEDPIVYFDNPVEAKMPNPFITIDEFKNAMLHRAEDQKTEFNQERNHLIYSNQQFEKFKHDVKHRTKVTPKIHYQLTTKLPIDNYHALVDNITNEIIEEVSHKLKIRAHEINATRSTPRELTTIKKIKKATKKINEVVDITTELTADESTQELKTSANIQNETASTVINATIQNNYENVTDEKFETKTTIMEQNVTEEKIETRPITEKSINTEPSKSSETSIKTTRTKQARPFVFMGGKQDI